MTDKSSKVILRENDLHPKKRFGQNFLIDKNILNKIAFAPNATNEDIFFEFGPGTGALTDYIINIAKKIYAIEFDNDMVSVLNEKFKGNDKIEIIKYDATEISLKDYYEKEKQEFIIMGNLPYNVAAHIIFNIIENNIDYVKECYFMVQREVAERLIEKNNSKNYSILTVLTDLFFEKTLLFDVKPTSFFPPPRIMSSIVKFKKTDKYMKSVKNFTLLKKIVKDAFSQRRKMLRNNLKEYNNLDKIINLNLRAENLTIQDYINITNFLVESNQLL